ncbi:MAG: 3-deoxy-manno-octulosonate cytidylyltransferase [Verrucomicrobia bacterium]|nr:3-deoxy-manno-octulosonate cytidylyltransferase [Verrucomicrobiota bacterium]
MILFIISFKNKLERTMKAICIIPARYNSSRFPGKLLALAHGKTILQRTFESALRCKKLSDLFVATDDEQIASHIQKLGGQIIWTSPHCKNGTERIAEALTLKPELQKADIIVNLQGDHPCTTPDAISAIIGLLRDDPGASMSTAAVPLHDPIDFFSPHVVKCLFDQHFNALYFSRSPIPYSPRGMPKKAYHHIGLYGYRTPFLLSTLAAPPTELQLEEDLEQLKTLELGYRIKVAVINDTPLGVDTPQDLVRLETHLKSLVVC